MTCEIRTTRLQHSLVLSFSNPSNEVLLTTDILASMTEIFDLAEDDATLSTIIVSDRGNSFDLSGLDCQGLEQTLALIGDFSKPVISVIHGRCSGAGSVIALAGDVLVCGPEASLTLNTTDCAWNIDAARALLPTRLSRPALMELACSGIGFTARQLHEAGVATLLLGPEYRSPDVALDYLSERYRNAGTHGAAVKQWLHRAPAPTMEKSFLS